MVNEAENEFLVISDSDVRVEPNYLRTVVARCAPEKWVALTGFYVSIHDETLVQHLPIHRHVFRLPILEFWSLSSWMELSSPSDRPLLQPARTLRIGGYEAIENKPADDLLVAVYRQKV